MSIFAHVYLRGRSESKLTNLLISPFPSGLNDRLLSAYIAEPNLLSVSLQKKMSNNHSGTRGQCSLYYMRPRTILHLHTPPFLHEGFCWFSHEDRDKLDAHRPGYTNGGNQNCFCMEMSLNGTAGMGVLCRKALIRREWAVQPFPEDPPRTNMNHL